MNKDELLARWPLANIKSDPLPGCPKCKGGGRVMKPTKQVTYCICVQFSGTEDYRRTAVRGILNH